MKSVTRNFKFLLLLLVLSPAVQAQEFAEAEALISKKKWTEAVIVLRSVLKAKPNHTQATIHLARALTYLGRREEALSSLVQAANLEKGIRLGALARQTRVLSRLFVSNATYQIYQEGLNFLPAKRYRNAREKFEKALLMEPNNVELLTRIGQCFVMESDFDTASERLKLAKRLNPYEPETDLWLGRALHYRGELPESVELLRSALKELPSSELAPIWLAEALNASGQRGGAIEILENDLQKQPYHLQSLLALARLRSLATPASKDPQSLWSARQALQLAQSRLDQYASPKTGKFESDLGLDLRDPDQVKTDIQALFERLDSRMDNQPASR